MTHDLTQGFPVPRKARLGAASGLLAAMTLVSACVTPPPPPTPAADMPGKAVAYSCAKGGPISVTYGNGTALLPGPENLLLEEGGTGQRYSWPSDGTHHVWVLDAAGTGTLLLKDGTKGGAESVVKSGCKAKA